jgi:septal ring factor EnvC (AmiA/AmiB activator)
MATQEQVQQEIDTVKRQIEEVGKENEEVKAQLRSLKQDDPDWTVVQQRLLNLSRRLAALEEEKLLLMRQGVCRPGSDSMLP